MRKIQLDNSDLSSYLNTINELKNHPSMDEYRAGYRKLRDDDAFAYEINNIGLHIQHCADWIRKDNLFWIALLVSLIL
ncbi:Uncharacterised protein [Serratia grimesii]|nr:Uncharacterised protein [Serratia grimesii]